MKLGIVGLPNVGKSTLFNAITLAGAEIANYPFTTIEPNIGVVAVPDGRLQLLAKLNNSAKITEATIEFIDIAGLVKGASRGEGLGNQFLSNIRMADAIVHVCRCFEDENVSHIAANLDPVRDLETVQLELILSDIELLERRLDKTERLSKVRHDSSLKAEHDFIEKLLAFLNQGQAGRNYIPENESEIGFMRNFFLLSSKPILVVANVSENDAAAGNKYSQALIDHLADDEAEVIIISAKIESEIRELPPRDRQDFYEEIGLQESGLDRLIKASYKSLDLISFLTAKEAEARAWTIPRGYKASQAAGVIHSDFERGFIAAEVIPYTTLEKIGSLHLAREKGLVRKEGRNYLVEDGDVILFRFNV
ncbi:MAG: redox-regulated ATPase YchF [Clostridiaceae bacterium]|jgi:GTP-binding protein YchF|nr:redox-regulated ATPase YchF [Clostridiaceae bacterium]